MSTAKAPKGMHDRMKSEFLSKERYGGELRVLKSLKIFRTIITNLIILAAIWLLLQNGADPNTVTILGLGGFMLYNGVELAELSAFLGALAEATGEVNDERE